MVLYHTEERVITHGKFFDYHFSHPSESTTSKVKTIQEPRTNKFGQISRKSQQNFEKVIKIFGSNRFLTRKEVSGS